MLKVELWDRAAKIKGELVKVPESDVKGIHRCSWKDQNGNSFDGCKVELVDGKCLCSWQTAEDVLHSMKRPEGLTVDGEFFTPETPKDTVEDSRESLESCEQ